MDRAVGAKIADYLIKPVNPNQVLISIKKCLHQKELVQVESTAGYQSNYSQLANDINKASTFEDFTGQRRLCQIHPAQLRELVP